MQYPLELGAGRVYIDPGRATGDALLHVLVHENIHTLGRLHPDADRFPDTIMIARSTHARGGHVLSALDREALLAAYGWLADFTHPGELMRELGPWSDASFHIRGDIDAVEGAAFGVAVRNGLAQPWTSGPTPYTNLADNTALSGTVSWSGLLMGAGIGVWVGGDADMSIELASLAGDLAFTDMEQWANLTDISPGTGETWGDGELSCSVGVRGNTFVQTGGDAGIVTGAFFGPSHEGMGGTLNRSDLAAAFGGSR